MNELQSVVTAIIGEPFQEHGMWFVKVKISCWGSESETIIGKFTKFEINKVCVGTKVLT